MSQSGAGAGDIGKEFDAFMEAYSNSTQAAGPDKWKRLKDFVGQGFKGTLEVPACKGNPVRPPSLSSIRLSITACLFPAFLARVVYRTWTGEASVKRQT